MHAFGEEQLAPANGIELCYQEMGDPDGEPLLLVMGLATQMIAWDEEFCALLAERGFRVVRFDNRDIGRSTKLSSAGAAGHASTCSSAAARTAPYLLRDMAADTFGLMDHLGIDSAHLVGASMGGMIVQTAAIEHPERVRSLTSIMSTTGSRRVGHPSYRTFGLLLGNPPREREAAIERVVKTFKVIGSPGYPFDEERVREIAGRSFDRGHSRPASPASCTRSPPPATAPRRCAGSSCPPSSSTARTTCSSTPPAAAPPPRRSPAPACG